jgi:hypothetical protein
MALWGISTTTETAANNYAIPKYNHEVDRNRSPWNTFADVRGWIQRQYSTTEHSGLSTSYYDEVLVPVAGLNTAGSNSDTGATGLSAATPVAVFFEDPNQASPISIGAGGTDRIRRNGQTAYVHVVWNENVYCGAGATVQVVGVNTLGAVVNRIVATAASVAPNCAVAAYTNDEGYTLYDNFNGQISNRVAFAFTSGNAGIGTVLQIHLDRGVVGTITDFSGGGAVVKVFTSDIIHNVGGAGTHMSVDRDLGLAVGIGTTTLTVTA